MKNIWVFQKTYCNGHFETPIFGLQPDKHEKYNKRYIYSLIKMRNLTKGMCCGIYILVDGKLPKTLLLFLFLVLQPL